MLPSSNDALTIERAQSLFYARYQFLPLMAPNLFNSSVTVHSNRL
jgi:hypothetical protein